MFIAFGLGCLASRLPMRSLLGSQLRLTAALAPPTLVAFGIVKLIEILQSNQPAPPSEPGQNAGEVSNFR